MAPQALAEPRLAPATNDSAFDAIPVLGEKQIVAITGGYKRPADQLAELRRQGFFRARISRLTGRIVLEREHYVAVCRGATIQAEKSLDRPKVQPLTRRS
jgi:hypothetical protein